MKFKKTLSIILAAIIAISTLGMLSSAETNEIKSYKNVIYMIGDGMGYYHWELAKQERDVELFLDTAALKGFSQTRSADNEVTDSAAGATALACATRTLNGAIGVYPTDPLNVFKSPKSLTEVAIENGMKTGVVTSDATTGATPSGFSVHAAQRNMGDYISSLQEKSDIDLIWGAATGSFNAERAEKNGFTVVTNTEEMNALESGSKSFGQFSGTTWMTVAPEDDTSPRLSQMTVKAIDLLDDDKDGFFLMIEGAHIDKRSHSQDPEGAADAVEEFDNAVEAAVKYAEASGDTLVVVTADHETGKIVIDENGKYVYTQGSHSATNVPVVVFDAESNFITPDETIKNIDIPVRIADALDFEDGSFPAKGLGVVPAFFKGLFDKLIALFDGGIK